MFMSIEKLINTISTKNATLGQDVLTVNQSSDSITILGTTQPITLKIFNKAVNIKQSDLDIIQTTQLTIVDVANLQVTETLKITHQTTSTTKTVSINSLARKIFRINWIENSTIIKFDHDKTNNQVTITNTTNNTQYTLNIIDGFVTIPSSDYEALKQKHTDDNGKKLKVTDIVKTTRPDYTRKSKEVTTK